MSDVSTKKRYSIGEEIANAVTHGIGAQHSIVALVLLLLRAVQCAPAEQKSFYIIGIAIFGGSLIILYLASTLYHALSNPTAKRVFGVFDHSSIYLLIAGTYSAYCLTALHGALGWTILAIIWALAITGITFYSIFGSKMRKLSAISYIPMGLMIVVVSPAVKSSLHAASGGNASWYFLLLGGVFYIAGTAFYAMKKIKWMHSIWHLFVIAGSVMHFASIYLIMR